MTMDIGTNTNYYALQSAAVPGSHGIRWYCRKPNLSNSVNGSPPQSYVPPTYASLGIPSGAHAMLTLFLTHTELVAGTLDDAIVSFFQTCPPRTLVTLWQEVGNTSLDYGTYGVTTANISTMNSRVQTLINNNKSTIHNVQFGNIVLGLGALRAASGTGYDNMHQVMSGGPFDFYGCDLYDDQGFWETNKGAVSQSVVEEKLGYWYTAAKDLSNKSAPLTAVGEINSANASHRENFFGYAGDWMGTHRCQSFLTHWDDTGGSSGPWIPCSTKNVNGCNTISALKKLQASYGTKG